MTSQGIFRLGDRVVLESAVIVAKSNEDVSFYPFATNKDEGIVLRVNIVEDNAVVSALGFSKEGVNLIMNFNRFWADGSEVSVIGVEIVSEDGTEPIEINFSCLLMGQINSYTVKYTITIFEGANYG